MAQLARDRTEAAVDWLLRSDEPAVRYLTRRDVLGEAAEDDRALILDGPKVRALLAQQPGHPYRKWVGAHWRLVSLVELELPAGNSRAVEAFETVLAWLAGDGHRRALRVVNGLVRRCASQEGNALAVGCRLGLADDPRVQLLAESLVEWQWPDGGWNCDDRATGRRSSFNESLAPMWGLHEYADAAGAAWAGDAAARTAELFLEHRVFRSLSTGEPIHPNVVKLRWPPYWHYGVLHALLILSRLGVVADPRAADALDLVEERRLPDGRWRADGRWWRPPGSKTHPEVVDWGRSGPNEMVTLSALRILRAAGRI